MSFGVYQIELNGKLYIGSTSQSFEKRWGKHLYDLRKGAHHSRYLQRSFNKYGEDELKFSVLEITEDQNECIPLEQKYLDEISPQYNHCKTAGSTLGVRLSDEHKEKLSKALKGKKLPPRSDEYKGKQSVAHKGKKASEETRKKMSASRKGKVTNLGYKHTEIAKMHMSLSKVGRIPSGETRQKIREAKLGTKLSNETRSKISASLLGKPLSEETKAKLRGRPAWNKGKKASEESRIRMSNAQKGHTPWNKGATYSEQAKSNVSKGVLDAYASGKLVAAHGASHYKSKVVRQFTMDGNLVKEYPTMTLAEEGTGISKTCICYCCKGKQKSTGGYKWEYAS